MNFNFIIKQAFSVLAFNKKMSILTIFIFYIGLLLPVSLTFFDSVLSSSNQIGAKSILGSDIELSSQFPFSSDFLSELNLDIDKHVKDTSTAYSIMTMASSGENLTMVSLASFDGIYPFYGAIETQTQLPLKVIPRGEIVVKNDLLMKLSLNVGDIVSIGNKEFKIGQVIKKDMGESLVLGSIAPRVYMNVDELKGLGLLDKGSRVSYKLRLKLKEQYGRSDLISTLSTKIRTKLSPDVSLKDITNVNDTFTRGAQIIMRFSQLVFLCGVLMSISVIVYIFNYFLSTQQDNIYIYKYLGLDSLKIYLIYLFVFLFDFLFASFFIFITNLFFALLYSKTILFSSLLAPFILVTLFLLFFISIIFPFVKDKIESISLKFYQFLPALLILTLILYFQTKSVFIAPLVLSFILFLLLLFSYLVPRVIKLFGSRGSFEFRYAIKSLVRNKSVLVSKFLILFLCLFVLNLVAVVFSSIKNDLSLVDSRPDYFVFDIQDYENLQMENFLKDSNIKYTALYPMINARLSKIKGEDVKIDFDANSFEGEQRNRIRNRSVNISYADELNESERIVSGVFFDKDNEKKPLYEVSLEKRYADRLNVGIGDELEFDVFNMIFKVKVSSIRQVKWTSFLPNFFILFSPTLISDAPKTYLTTLYNVDDYNDVLRLSKEFRGVTIIDIKELTASVFSFLDKFEKILFLMVTSFLMIAGICFSSLLVFNLIMQAGDNRLLLILGLNKNRILKIRVYEYLSIIGFANLCGVLLAFASAYFITNQVLNIDLILDLKYFLINLISLLGLLLFTKKRLGID